MGTDTETFAKKYRIIKRLGTGGMAEVFLARQVGIAQFEKLVAIKTILPNQLSNQEIVNMFIDEARLAAQLGHANIVQVYDFGITQGVFYIIMEYIRGASVADLLSEAYEKGEVIPLDIALHIMSAVCQGLDYAHRKQALDGTDLKIIHRDLDPQNILVSYEGEVKITDFGIARASMRIHKTTDGVLKGKVNYMSPEMIRGKDIDQRADVFALGIIFYEIVSGRRPFLEGTTFRIFEKIVKGEYEPIQLAAPNLPDPVAEVISKAMETDPDKRFQSSREMLLAVEQLRSSFAQRADAMTLSQYVLDLFHNSQEKPALDLAREDSKILSSPFSSLPFKDGTLTVSTVGELSENRQMNVETDSNFLKDDYEDFGISESERMELFRGIARSSDEDSDRWEVGRYKPKEPYRTRKWFSVFLSFIVIVVLAGGLYYAFPNWILLKPLTKEASVLPKAVETPVVEAPEKLPVTNKATVNDTPQAAKGYLKLNITPADAHVFINGVPKGQASGIGVLSLPAGKQSTVRVVKAGLGEKTVPVTLSAGQTKTLPITLSAAEAFVSFSADMPCAVHFDGTFIGNSPIASFTTTAGNHTAVLTTTTPALSKTVPVSVKAGKTKKVHVQFLSSLMVSADPWADVYLDGKKIGLTPLTKNGITPGNHSIRLVNPKLEKDIQETRSFISGQTVHVTKNLQN